MQNLTIGKQIFQRLQGKMTGEESFAWWDLHKLLHIKIKINFVQVKTHCLRTIYYMMKMRGLANNGIKL